MSSNIFEIDFEFERFYRQNDNLNHLRQTKKIFYMKWFINQMKKKKKKTKNERIKRRKQIFIGR